MKEKTKEINEKVRKKEITPEEAKEQFLFLFGVINLVCDRCGYKNNEEYIRHFEYCENCGLKMKQTCL